MDNNTQHHKAYFDVMVSRCGCSEEPKHRVGGAFRDMDGLIYINLNPFIVLQESSSWSIYLKEIDQFGEPPPC